MLEPERLVNTSGRSYNVLVPDCLEIAEPAQSEAKNTILPMMR